MPQWAQWTWQQRHVGSACEPAAVRSATVTVSAQAVQLLVLLKADLDALIASGVLNPECVQALAKVAETRRLENKQRASKI